MIAPEAAAVSLFVLGAIVGAGLLVVCALALAGGNGREDEGGGFDHYA